MPIPKPQPPWPEPAPPEPVRPIPLGAPPVPGPEPKPEPPILLERRIVRLISVRASDWREEWSTPAVIQSDRGPSEVGQCLPR